MKSNLTDKLVVIVCVLNFTGCCNGNGVLDSDQRVSTPDQSFIMGYTPGDGLLGEFTQDVNNFDH